MNTEPINVGDRFRTHGGTRAGEHTLRVTAIDGHWITSIFEEHPDIERCVTIDTYHRLLQGTANGKLTRIQES